MKKYVPVVELMMTNTSTTWYKGFGDDIVYLEAPAFYTVVVGDYLDLIHILTDSLVAFPL